MEQTYLDIMIQSLNKKIQVLDKIAELNLLQKKQLEDMKVPVEEFDNTIEEKGKLIEQLELLDAGFDKLYDRVKSELQTNREAYAPKIAQMQECIRQITAKNIDIQAQEARNKELMIHKFAFIKQSAKIVRTNTRVVSKYHNNMLQLNYVDPQFMDNKK